MRRHSVAQLLMAALVAAGAGAGCSVDEKTPSFTGPSEFALSVSLVAAPDQLPRDGSSQSIVTATVLNEAGRPVAGQRLAVMTNVGTVSESEIVTGDDGRASFAFVAPSSSASAGLNSAVLQVTPIGGNTRTTLSRTLNIPLVNAAGITSVTAPTASFAFSPSAPVLRATVTFDASATTDEGVRCLDLCTYSWDFGGEATRTGRIVTYEFQVVRSYAVTLTVTDPAGAVGTETQNVSVTQGSAPTASISFSPSSPAIFETVNFTGEASKVEQAGRTIVNHQWQFGDGTSATGLRVTKSYDRTGTFTVVLTVTDSAGAQGTATKDVTVVAGVTADFTISPTDPGVDQEVVFNAEASKGSSGFGGRNPITKYIWNFGKSDRTTEETDPITSTTYSRVGTYTVVLTVEDSAGRRATTSKTVTVK